MPLFEDKKIQMNNTNQQANYPYQALPTSVQSPRLENGCQVQSANNELPQIEPLTTSATFKRVMMENPHAQMTTITARPPKSRRIYVDFGITMETSEEIIMRNRRNAKFKAGLYYEIKNNLSPLDEVIKKWIEKFKKDQNNALLTLMQFFIDSSGCKGLITPEMQANMEHKLIIRKMICEFDDGGHEKYPLIMTGQCWKEFEINFCEFIQNLVFQCQNLLIDDTFLLENVIPWLSNLSMSVVRAFRHTATLAAMKLMTALRDVALKISVNHDDTLRQYLSEKEKSYMIRNCDLLLSLSLKLGEHEKKRNRIEKMLNIITKSVFERNCYDWYPKISATCVVEIGVWIKKSYPDFVYDIYLEHIYRILYTKDEDLRLKCLETLKLFYESTELSAELVSFTKKCIKKIFYVTQLYDSDVSVYAVELVIFIHQRHQYEFTEDDCETIYKLVFSSYRSVAQIAGKFLNTCLLSQDKKKTIRNLVLLAIASKERIYPINYLVDSLIEINPIITDWQYLTDLLLEHSDLNESTLSDEDKTILIEIMVSSIVQIASGEPPNREKTGSKSLSEEEQMQVKKNRRELTIYYIKKLPSLLEKYNDTEKLINLLLIPRYFELNIYSQYTEDLEKLLKKIYDIVENFSDKDVIETATMTLKHLCIKYISISTKSNISSSKFIDSIYNKYKESSNAHRNVNEEGKNSNEDQSVRS